MNDNNSTFHVSQDYEILPLKRDKAYPIPKIEWEYLKDRIRKSLLQNHAGHTICCGPDAKIFQHVVSVD